MLPDPISWRVVANWVSDIKVPKQQSTKLAVAVKRNGKVFKTKEAVRQQAIRERGHKCESCGLTEWLDKPIMLEAHRVQAGTKGGKYTLDNIKLLCPNCHSMTENWKNRK